VIGKLLGV